MENLKRKKTKKKGKKIDLPMHRFNWTLGFLNNLKSKRKKEKKKCKRNLTFASKDLIRVSNNLC